MNRHRSASPLASRPALGLRDHGGTQIDTGDGSATRCEQSAPAADATADIEDPHARGDLQPRLERAPLTDVDEPVVEAGHSVGADRGQAVAGDRKALRAGFPIVGGAVTRRRERCGSSHHLSLLVARVWPPWSSCGSLGSGS